MYDVVITGKVASEEDINAVALRLAELCKISVEQAAGLLTKPVAIKRDVDEPTAQRYQAALLRIGVQCEIRAKEAPALVAPVPVPSRPSPPPSGLSQVLPAAFLSREPPGTPGAGAKPSESTFSAQDAPLPPDIKGWSWGAFLLNWVWAIGNRTWIGLWTLAPFGWVVMPLVLGFKGREWAWKNKRWDSVEHFNAVQRKWSVWGVVVGVPLTLAAVGGIAISAYEKNPADPTEQADISGSSSTESDGSGAGEGFTAEDLALSYQRNALRAECFGEHTNTCTNKSIDYNIELLKNIQIVAWIPFTDVRTEKGMVEVFGEDGWKLFEDSVKQVRELVIQHLDSRRPSWASLHFRGDDPPDDAGVSAFNGPEDLLLIKDEIKKVFIEKLHAAGWTPTAEAAARFAPNSAPAPSSPPAAPVEPPASPSAEGQVQPGASGSTSDTNNAAVPSAEDAEAIKKQQWNAIKEQITANPTEFVQDCVEHHIEVARNRDGMSLEKASEGADEACTKQLAQFRNCMAMDPFRGNRCYEQLTQDRE
jgi:hypothetical protein